MNSPVLKVLLVDDNAAFARLVHESLIDHRPGNALLTHVGRMPEALTYLASESPDIVLVNLGISDTRDLESVRLLHKSAPDVPIVVLSALDDPEAELQSLQEGVQDYLTESDVKQQLLMRAIRHAIERQKSQGLLRGLALVDDLTGLSNSRGFLALAEQHLKLARRNKRAFALLFTDLDGLKFINDTYGHVVGNQAIAEMAAIFRASVRGSDIAARLGGDEFCALLIDATEATTELVRRRLIERLEARNASPDQPYPLSISAGILWCQPEDDRRLDELLADVDARMYRDKRARRAQASSR